MGDYYSGLRTFEMLSDSEKIKAILATVKEPVSKEFALQLAGIDPVNENKVDSIFSESSVIQSGSGQDVKFILSAPGKESLGNIDWESVHKKIADDLYEEF